MTKEQKQIAVAKLDGYQWFGDIPFNPERPECLRCWRKPEQSVSDGKFYYELSDYLHSRDAIIPVIEKQGNKVHYRLQAELWNILEADQENNLDRSCACYFLFATPEQLVDALLKATGQWKD